MKNIAVIGTGYVGLATGACLAKLGHRVVCADIDEKKVAELQKGRVPILENGLPELVNEGIARGRLSFIVGAANAVHNADFIYLCLPTPQGADGSADLSYLYVAVDDIALMLKPGAILINKSTVPVGTAASIRGRLGSRQVHVASNPEFLREGSAVHDFFHPDRIVIGAHEADVAAAVAGIYENIDAPVMLVDAPTAELIKYAANAFLATKISFANSIATLCETVGANAHDVLEGMGMDRRIGRAFLKPGPGWGGSCFPKDTYALIHTAEGAGYDFDLLKSVIRTNDVQIDRMVKKATKLVGGSVEGKTIAAWGLSFKAGTDDVRQSPSIEILRRLKSLGANIQAFDPAVKQAPYGFEVMSSPIEACAGADLLLVLTEWPEFADVPLELVAEQMNDRRVLDTRNIIKLEKLRELWFEFQSIGNIARKAASES
jgi:UDPglucose 6-dehydrogenase